MRRNMSVQLQSRAAPALGFCSRQGQGLTAGLKPVQHCVQMLDICQDCMLCWHGRGKANSVMFEDVTALVFDVCIFKLSSLVYFSKLSTSFSTCCHCISHAGESVHVEMASSRVPLHTRPWTSAMCCRSLWLSGYRTSKRQHRVFIVEFQPKPPLVQRSEWFPPCQMTKMPIIIFVCLFQETCIDKGHCINQWCTVPCSAADCCVKKVLLCFHCMTLQVGWFCWGPKGKNSTVLFTLAFCLWKEYLKSRTLRVGWAIQNRQK